MSETGERTPRKIVFISMIDATNEEMHQLSDAVHGAGLSSDYHFILSGQPVQSVDPIELVNSLKMIHEFVQDGDPNNVGISRTARLRDLIRYVNQMSDQINNYIEVNEKNIETLTAEANLLRGLLNAGHESVYTSLPSAVQDLKNTALRIQAITPNEGEMI